MKKLIILSLSLSCALVRNPKPEIPVNETVGNLSPSDSHVAVQPVHKSTDFTPPQVIDTDTEKPEVIKSTDSGAEEPEKVEKQSHGF